jgi:hypothetical protein
LCEKGAASFTAATLIGLALLVQNILLIPVPIILVPTVIAGIAAIAFTILAYRIKQE